MLHDTVAKDGGPTITKTEGEVQTKALVEKLPYILTLVRSETLVDTVVITLA